MSLSPVPAEDAERVRTAVRLSDRAVAALTTELARHGGPKTGLVIGVRPESPVLIAALEAILADDRLTLVAADGTGDEVRAFVTDRGAWVGRAGTGRRHARCHRCARAEPT